MDANLFLPFAGGGGFRDVIAVIAFLFVYPIIALVVYSCAYPVLFKKKFKK